MRLPPWAIQAIRNGVADVARKASDAETIARVKEQATELLRDLPENASRGIDAIVKSATDRARGAFDQGRESILRWRERQSDVGVRLCNAQGVLFTPLGTGIPVPDEVLQVGCEVFSGDCVDDDFNSRLAPSFSKLLDVEPCELIVANSLDAAIASLGVIAQGRTMVLHRSHAIRLPSGTPLPDALPAESLQQCGGVQAVDPGDFQRITEPACVIFADDGEHAIDPIDFGGRDVVVVAIVPYATIVDSDSSIPSARRLLRSGIDLVVMQGGPLIGSTNSGILAGRSDLVAAIRQDQTWATYAASAATTAMTLASMQLAGATPVSVLMSTAEENLRSRAERMATRLSADESIATCQITDRPASLVEGARWTLASRQLRLRHRQLSAETWAQQLRRRTPAIAVSIDGEDLVVDLRWLPASDDATVAEALGSEKPEHDTGSVTTADETE